MKSELDCIIIDGGLDCNYSHDRIIAWTDLFALTLTAVTFQFTNYYSILSIFAAERTQLLFMGPL